MPAALLEQAQELRAWSPPWRTVGVEREQGAANAAQATTQGEGQVIAFLVTFVVANVVLYGGSWAVAVALERK